MSFTKVITIFRKKKNENINFLYYNIKMSSETYEKEIEKYRKSILNKIDSSPMSEKEKEEYRKKMKDMFDDIIKNIDSPNTHIALKYFKTQYK